MPCCARIASICGRAAVHDDEANAEAVEQVEIMDDAEERFVGHDFAAERDDERLAAKGVDIRAPPARIHWTNARIVAECAVGAALVVAGIGRWGESRPPGL